MEDIEFLNDIDRGYIGLTKPQVQHIQVAPTLQDIQGDWPMKDYLAIDSGMTPDDLKERDI